MTWGPGGWKSRLAKAAGAEPSGHERWTIARRCGTKHISKHFWKLRHWKSMPLWSQAQFEVNKKCTKHTILGALLEVEMLKKCTRLWREAHVQVKTAKSWWVRSTFGRSDVVLRGRRKGLCTLSKVSKMWRFCSIAKSIGRRGAFEEDPQRCISRGRRGTRDMLIRDVRRSGHWFPEKGCMFEHRIFRFAKMILRDRCRTSYDLASLFRGRSAFRQMEWKNRKRIDTRLSALHFWRKSRRIASLLMLSTWKIEDVSHNSFLFEVVKFKNWRSLADLLCFWCCQLRKLRKSRRICFWRCQVQQLRKSHWNAAFLMLSSSKIEEVSQNSFVFELADRQIDR